MFPDFRSRPTHPNLIVDEQHEGYSDMFPGDHVLRVSGLYSDMIPDWVVDVLYAKVYLLDHFAQNLELTRA